MTLGDIVRGKEFPTIMVRCNYPKVLEKDLSDEEKDQGLLFGYCDICAAELD